MEPLKTFGHRSDGIGSDSGMRADDRLENELGESSRESIRTERRPTDLTKAVGGREDSLRNGKKAVTGPVPECQRGPREKESRTPAFLAWAPGGSSKGEREPQEKQQVSRGTDERLNLRQDKLRCLRRPGKMS